MKTDLFIFTNGIINLKLYFSFSADIETVWNLIQFYAKTEKTTVTNILTIIQGYNIFGFFCLIQTLVLKISMLVYSESFPCEAGPNNQKFWKLVGKIKPKKSCKTQKSDILKSKRKANLLRKWKSNQGINNNWPASNLSTLTRLSNIDS